MNVLVTGATGFVGQAFVAEALAHGWSVRAVSRSPDAQFESCQTVFIPTLDENTDWREALSGCDAVVHCAARAHVMEEDAADSLSAFRRVNTEATIRLAQQAAEAGVKRFLFMSTVKVNGEGRASPYTQDDAAGPEGPYAISKYEAEKGLLSLSKETGMALTIIRPPLVYGPNVRANFLKLIQIVARGFPLPFGRIANKRSLVYVGNLVSAMAACLESEDTKNALFFVSDGEDVSTPELITRLAQALGTQSRLVPVPVCLLRAVGKLSGKTKQIDRLLGSLCVDPSALHEKSGWTPPYTMQEGLAKTAQWFIHTPVL